MICNEFQENLDVLKCTVLNSYLDLIYLPVQNSMKSSIYESTIYEGNLQYMRRFM